MPILIIKAPILESRAGVQGSEVLGSRALRFFLLVLLVCVLVASAL